MTKGQAIELGRRAVAAGWKWQVGAATTFGWRVLTAYAQTLRVVTGDHGELLWRENSAVGTPDFRDPATLGILLAQVRERFNEPGIFTVGNFAREGCGMWSVDSYRIWRGLTAHKKYPTEAEALVAALEAAKEHKP